jgi:hypothetical protein
MFLHVTLDDLDAVVDAMDELADAGRGWINLVPEHVDRHELAAVRSVPGMIFGRLGGRGAPDPKVTWTAPELRRKRVEPAQLGIEHPAGPKARRQLDEAGHGVPSGWVVTQDHPLRGLVVVPAAGVGHAEVVRWGLGAASVLAGGGLEVWQAQVFPGR